MGTSLGPEKRVILDRDSPGFVKTPDEFRDVSIYDDPAAAVAALVRR